MSEMWPFKKKEKKISRERFLGSVPVKNPVIKWEEANDGTITLIIPRNPSSLPSFLQKQLSLPQEKKVKLDEIGSKVWLKIDGKTNMQEFIEWFSNEYKVSLREAEVSLNMFFSELSKRGFIAMLVPLPKPGTPEAKDEINELREQLKSLEKDFKKKKIPEDQYSKIKEVLEEKIKYLEGNTSNV